MKYSDWFERAWWDYPAEGPKKGAKRMAFESWKKIGARWAKEERKAWPDAEEEFFRLCKKDFDYKKDLIEAERKKGGHFPIPHLATYLNQWRFEQAYEKTLGDYKREEQESAPESCQCGADAAVRVGGGVYCESCYRAGPDKDNTEALRAAWRRVAERVPKHKDEALQAYCVRAMKAELGKLHIGPIE